jgi:hypothetical protein
MTRNAMKERKTKCRKTERFLELNNYSDWIEYKRANKKMELSIKWCRR